MELEPGTMMTPTVRLVRPLAVGGMGTVWVADHTTLETQVAVKIMTAELTHNPEISQRFSREAAASARVKSPHVVQVFDHGTTQGGLPFIVMELLDGHDLAHLVQAGPLDLAVVIEIVAQTCKALTRAHAAGVIHRDIKPDNIFVCDTDGGEPFVKLLDFGIAKSGSGPASMSVTAPGSVFGTPLYMSPEQLVGDPTDLHTDLWSLGVVAFEALTGTSPYGGDTIGAVAIAAHAPLPTPSSRRPELPAWVDAWFAKACAVSPGDRFESAADMARAMHDPSGVPVGSPTLVSSPALVAKAAPAPLATTIVPSSHNPPLPTSNTGTKIGVAMAVLAGVAVLLFVLARPTPAVTPSVAAPPPPAAQASVQELAAIPSATPAPPASAASSATPKSVPSAHKPASKSRPHGPKKPAEYNDIK